MERVEEEGRVGGWKVWGTEVVGMNWRMRSLRRWTVLWIDIFNSWIHL